MRTIDGLYLRLAALGFDRAWVRVALLPDWWPDGEAERDSGLLPDMEFMVARFLGMPLAEVRDPNLPLRLLPCAVPHGPQKPPITGTLEDLGDLPGWPKESS